MSGSFTLHNKFISVLKADVVAFTLGERGSGCVQVWLGRGPSFCLRFCVSVSVGENDPAMRLTSRHLRPAQQLKQSHVTVCDAHK